MQPKLVGIVGELTPCHQIGGAPQILALSSQPISCHLAFGAVVSDISELQQHIQSRLRLINIALRQQRYLISHEVSKSANMAPKKNARDSTPSAAATAQSTTSTPAPAPPTQKTTSSTSAGAANWDQVLQNIYNFYTKEASQRTQLIDAFLAFLIVVGALQFLYCILAGNYVGTLYIKTQPFETAVTNVFFSHI